MVLEVLDSCTMVVQVVLEEEDPEDFAVVVQGVSLADLVVVVTVVVQEASLADLVVVTMAVVEEVSLVDLVAVTVVVQEVSMADLVALVDVAISNGVDAPFV